MDVGNDRFVDLLLYIFLSAAFRQRQKQEFGTMLVNQKPATRAVFLLLTRIASNAREFWFTTNAHAHRLRGLEKRPMRKAVTNIENKIDIALTTAVHELIEYLRYQDIQALDEEEFLLRVRELIRVEQDERLPF